jgi:hypothetical protein
MSFRPCSICEQRFPGKPATLYSAWFRVDGVRTAYKQRLCPGCFATAYLETLRGVSAHDGAEQTCPLCGASTKDDLDPIYLTLYLPKQPEREYEIGSCAACAAKLRIVLQQGGEPLADRTRQAGGPSPSPSAWESVSLD